MKCNTLQNLYNICYDEKKIRSHKWLKGQATNPGYFESLDYVFNI